MSRLVEDKLGHDVSVGFVSESNVEAWQVSRPTNPKIAPDAQDDEPTYVIFIAFCTLGEVIPKSDSSPKIRKTKKPGSVFVPDEFGFFRAMKSLWGRKW